MEEIMGKIETGEADKREIPMLEVRVTKKEGYESLKKEGTSY